MSSQLLVIDPSQSTSMLGPLFALEVFLARPHRWQPSFLDKTFDGIKVLPTSRLKPVFSTWSRERGLRFSEVGADQPLNEQVDAVLLFGNDASAAMCGFVSALGIEAITIDLESGTVTSQDDSNEHTSPLAVVPPVSLTDQRLNDGGYN